MSASKKSPDQIGLLAVGMVAEERMRQVKKGYSRDHDDDHASEELAAGTAFYLLPSWMNQDVCTANGGERLVIESLQNLVGAAAWNDISRDEDNPDDDLELRIRNVVRGCALGLAELERLIRMRKGGR
ncbi:hypothetical protein EM864_12570 [Stenotrophomonas acidaminiphila]|uniref:hypothetical protein n=1 Tax=Stenotrophomonas acidaminiphila TaxID=128780 RepID=UPI002405DCA6|nr:hypothetical protein [Stenotrophomonas acidaminiphila]MDF9442579.1 hypothetical protein [Stenotrophomonas acidaminiphila]